MGKRKPFIQKSKAVSFRLTPSGEQEALSGNQEEPMIEQKAPIIGDPELVNIVEVTEEELAEREKWGVYYQDNYNYLSHMKSKDEIKIDVPVQLLPKVGTNIIEIKGREISLSSKNAMSNIDGADEIDPEILEMLNDKEASEDELEDDFLQLAGGIEMPEGRRVFEEFRKTARIYDMNSDDDEMMDQDEYKDEPVQPILKNVKQSNPDKKELDERFKPFYDQMVNSDSNESDQCEDEEEQVDDAFLENLADDYEKDQIKYEKPDLISKELSLRAHRKQEMGYAEETERIETESTKRAKWDCRSVGSTYSNIYNHPAVIREEPKRKMKNRSPKELDTTDGDDKMDCDDAISTRSVCSTVRSRGETAEERRERKRAVKEERRERRIEKKNLKDMFKTEKKLSDRQRSHVYVSGRTIHE